MIFEPLTIKHVTFKNRLLRSSIGGRSSYYSGEVSPAWRNFERRFAQGGVAGIISATFTVDDKRWSPLEYPKLSDDRFIKGVREGVRGVQALGCRYILQIGDPGAHTQTSLFPQETDGKSASPTIDLLYGYGNRSTAMTEDEIAQVVDNFAQAARRVREAGCDGIEVTISKGYLLQQFLNPATNRRKDAYGGSIEKRFRLVRDVITAVRRAVGDDYLLGVRQSAIDYNSRPVNFRWPPVWPLRHYFTGNGLEENLYYARELKALGVDYLHMTSGFGFVNPAENSGTYPLEEIRLFANSTRHLSFKAKVRAAILNTVPDFVLRPTLGFGWGYVAANNAAFARRFREETGLPVIANGGFQAQDLIEEHLTSGSCDLVSMARPLLANPDLLAAFQAGKNMPDKPCTHCGRCCVRTAVFPLGCYDLSRFDSAEAMEAQILAWSATIEEQIQ